MASDLGTLWVVLYKPTPADPWVAWEDVATSREQAEVMRTETIPRFFFHEPVECVVVECRMVLAEAELAVMDEDIVSPQWPERVLFTKQIDLHPGQMPPAKPHTAVLAELMDADPNFEAGMAEMRGVVETEMAEAERQG